jgi:hypothetical protein
MLHNRPSLFVPPVQMTKTIQEVRICPLHGFLDLELVAPAESSNHHRFCVIDIQVSCSQAC